MTAPLAFRAATAADIDAVVALVESAYRGDASRAGWTTEADLLDGRRTGPDDVAAQLARRDSRILLAERDGRLLACAHVAVEDGAGYFGMFSVTPGLQGGGVGKQVLAEAERIARDEWGCAAMRMTVIDVRDELIARLDPNQVPLDDLLDSGGVRLLDHGAHLRAEDVLRLRLAQQRRRR